MSVVILQEEVVEMNRKGLLCVIILVLLGYYGHLVFDASQNNQYEKEIIKNTRETNYSHEDETDDVAEHKNLLNSEIDPKDNIMQNDTNHENGEKNTNSTVPIEQAAEQLPKGFDCIINIPSISLEKIVYTGNSRDERLQQYNLITATEDMKYVNGGNYIICGHYSQLYGHSLNRLQDVNEGDYVYIDSNNTIYKYKVQTVTFESMTDTSSFCKQTEEKELTIISCAKYVGPDQYIVVKCSFVKE